MEIRKRNNPMTPPPSQRESLPVLRKQLQLLKDEKALEGFASQLVPDERNGAEVLRKLALRRAKDLRLERARLKSLFSFRLTLYRKGFKLVAGVDEVGMGPLAGPVVAGAVILPTEVSLPGLNDSKVVSPNRREELAKAIREQAISYGIGQASVSEIDSLNIFQAGLLAMSRAVESLGEQPDYVLVDARSIPNLRVPQTSLIRGDSRDGSIAAASILAKVERDGLMRALDHRFPVFGFAKHKGYPTSQHLHALQIYGPCEVHRMSFGPVADRISSAPKGLSVLGSDGT